MEKNEYYYKDLIEMLESLDEITDIVLEKYMMRERYYHIKQTDSQLKTIRMSGNSHSYK